MTAFSMARTPGRAWFASIALVCAGALAVAFAAQYGLGLRPCVLCLCQRWPYAIAGAAGALMAAAPVSWRAPGAVSLSVIVIALAFSAGAGLAAVHVAIEQGWWTSPVCGGAPPQDAALEDLIASVDRPAAAPCATVRWSLFGLSLAGYNAIASLALSAYAVTVFISSRPHAPRRRP